METERDKSDDALFAMGEQELWWTISGAEIVEEGHTVEDAAVARACAAGAAIEKLAAARDEASRARREAVLQLRAAGWSHQKIADALGVKRSTAQAIAEGRSSSGRVAKLRRDRGLT